MELSSTVQSVLILTGLYILYGVVYRLYFSPIASFPGPKLAAVTWWYEVYYDVILGGKYIWKVQELHKKYGPIVRINPYLLHVDDPDFWDTLYPASNSNKRDRWHWLTRSAVTPNSLLGTVEQDLHRRRRASLSPYFSTQNVRRLQPVIDERISKMVERLQGLATSERTINIEHMFAAFTNDVVTRYCFGDSDHRLEKPDFDPEAFKKVAASVKAAQTMKHFGWIIQIMLSIPDNVALKMGKRLASLVLLRRERIPQIEEIRSQKRFSSADDENSTIFHTLLDSDLPESEKSSERMSQEAVLLVGAGTNTTSWALTVASFHLLSQPAILRKLKDELEAAIPERDAHISLVSLEKLPYLTAVCKEGLRLSYGSSSRIPRIAPDTTMTYKNWRIPPGTPVSMDIVSTHHNEDVFPDSRAFKPERWLGKDAAALERYFVVFAKGPRMCLGQNLAWAELYLALAGVFRRFGSPEVCRKDDMGVLTLFETDVTDVELDSDFLFAAGKKGSKGVRVSVSK